MEPERLAKEHASIPAAPTKDFLTLMKPTKGSC